MTYQGGHQQFLSIHESGIHGLSEKRSSISEAGPLRKQCKCITERRRLKIKITENYPTKYQISDNEMPTGQTTKRKKWEGPPSSSKLGEVACLGKLDLVLYAKSLQTLYIATTKSPRERPGNGFNRPLVPVVYTIIQTVHLCYFFKIDSCNLRKNCMQHSHNAVSILNAGFCTDRGTEVGLTSPALKIKRRWSKNRSTQGAVSPVSMPVPRICQVTHHQRANNGTCVQHHR